MIDYTKIHLLTITDIDGAIHRKTAAIVDFRPDFNPGEYVDPKAVDFVIAAPAGTYPVEGCIISRDECLQMVQGVVFAGTLR